MRSVIAQDEIFIPVHETHSPPVSSGKLDLIGNIVDGVFEAPHEASNDAKRTRSKKLLAPLLEHTLTVEFRANYWEALKNTLNSSSAIRFGDVETSTELKPVTIADLKQRPFLALRTLYHLSDDCTVLIVQTHLRYFQSGNNRPVHFGYMTYFSEEIDQKGNEAAMSRWAADGAAAYKGAVHQAIQETMKMLRFDMLESGAPVAGAQESTTIKYRDPLSLKKVAWKGTVLARDGDRMIFKESGGNLFSLSSKAGSL